MKGNLTLDNIQISYNIIAVNHHFVHDLLTKLKSEISSNHLDRLFINLNIEKENNTIIIKIIANDNTLKEDYIILSGKLQNVLKDHSEKTKIIVYDDHHQILYQHTTSSFLTKRVAYNLPQALFIFGVSLLVLFVLHKVSSYFASLSSSESMQYFISEVIPIPFSYLLGLLVVDHSGYSKKINLISLLSAVFTFYLLVHFNIVTAILLTILFIIKSLSDD